MTCEFEIGDKVKIINRGHTYDSYYEMSKELNSTKWHRGYFPEDGKIGIIKNIKSQVKHLLGEINFILVDLGDREIVISSQGLQKIEGGEKMEFKKGDRIIKARRYNSSQYCRYGGDECTVPIGTKGTIKFDSSQGCLDIKFDNGINWNVDSSEVELNTVSTSGFQIGDVIEGLPNSSRYSITTQGNGTGVVTKIKSMDEIEVEWTDKKGVKRSETFSVDSKCFKKVDLSTKVMTRICIDSSGYEGRLTKGKTYEMKYENPEFDLKYVTLTGDSGRNVSCYISRFNILGEAVKIRKGDKVRRINMGYANYKEGDTFEVSRVDISDGLIYDPEGKGHDIKNVELVETGSEDIKQKQTENGEVKMELKDVKPENLKEAQKQFETARMNAEIEYAKAELKRATDQIDYYDRQIKSAEDSKKPYLEILAKFPKQK